MAKKTCFSYLIVLFTLILVFSAFSEVKAQGHWWDKLGKPQYGGTFSFRVLAHMPSFDPGVPTPAAYHMQYDPLFSFDFTVDRATWPFNTNFAPIKYYTGILAESWEQTDPVTVIVHLRKGIHWQNMEPTNGREIVAKDIEFHYDRTLGTGSGFDTPSFFAGWIDLFERVTAVDKYTVQIKFKRPSVMGLFQLFDQANEHQIAPPEVAKLSIAAAASGPPGGLPKGGAPGAAKSGPKGPPMRTRGVDWKLAAGSGPWMIQDFVEGSVITFKKNPDYYLHDERYPENQIPYFDTLKILVIPDMATGLAAARTGKLDLINAVEWQQAELLKKSNPEMKQAAIPVGGPAIDMRCDKEPYTDIRVRKALQISIDRKTIAENYYGGLVDGTPIGLISTKGYNFEYKDWPQELKDEYSYNPEKAKQLLAEAGYPNGFKTNVVAASNADLQILQGIKSYFSNIGVDMDINVMEFPTLRSYVLNWKHDQMSYSSMSETGTTRPPTNSINMRHSKEKLVNLTNNNDPKYDELAEKFKNSLTEAEAQVACRAADRYALENHWAIYTMQKVNFNIWQPWLGGYSGEEATGGGGVGYAMLWARLWIDQDKKKSMGY